GAVFAEGSVKDGKYDVDFGMRAGLRDDWLRRPVPRAVDQEARNFIALRIHRRRHRIGRAQRDLMLAAPAAIHQCHTRFLHQRIFFPSADKINSTASSAVRLNSSITGFTSTTSIESIRWESQIISMARCASR